MRAGILKAMTKCCDRNAIGACGNIVYTRGSIYATDRYVLVKIDWEHDDGHEYAVDPKLLRKVVDAFSAAECSMQAEDWGQMTHYHGYSNRGKLLIDAIVMHERLR